MLCWECVRVVCRCSNVCNTQGMYSCPQARHMLHEKKICLLPLHITDVCALPFTSLQQIQLASFSMVLPRYFCHLPSTTDSMLTGSILLLHLIVSTIPFSITTAIATTGQVGGTAGTEVYISTAGGSKVHQTARSYSYARSGLYILYTVVCTMLLRIP